MRVGLMKVEFIEEGRIIIDGIEYKPLLSERDTMIERIKNNVNYLITVAETDEMVWQHLLIENNYEVKELTKLLNKL